MSRPREFDEERVLDAVMEAFWREGYEATSAQTLVNVTGLGRGSLYAAYGSKRGLFEQALLRYNRRAQAHVEQLNQLGSPIVRLRELMEGIVDADLSATESRGCFATNSALEMAGRDPSVTKLIRDNFRILERGIEGAIRRAQQEGEIVAGLKPELLALYVFNSIQGLRILAKTTPRKDRGKLMFVVEQTLAAFK